MNIEEIVKNIEMLKNIEMDKNNEVDKNEEEENECEECKENDVEDKNEGKKEMNKFELSNIFMGILIFGLLNITLFMYNMNCIEYYNDKIDNSTKFNIIYDIFKIARDYYILNIFEKILYVFVFLFSTYIVGNFIVKEVFSIIRDIFFIKKEVVDEKKKDDDKENGNMTFPFGLMSSMSNLTNSSKFVVEKKGETGVSLKDVAGCTIAKKELLELIDFLQNREKYISLGAQLPKGALLHGPSGTGKTMIAKALAHEVEYNYIYVQGSDFKKPLVGLGPSAVKDLFKTARNNAPCIIFVDEIDSIAKKRDSGKSYGNGGNEEDAILNTFLAELDGFKERGDVFVMGATNRLSVIDKALLRPKRFDRIIHFKLPNVDERYEIIESYFNKMKIDESLKEEMYIRRLAQKSFGFSGAQIYNMCNESAILAGKNNKEYIDEECINEALDYIHLGKTEEHIKKHLTEEEKKRTAYHETGHAIVAIMCKELENPTQISIVPHNKGSLGVTIAPINEHKYSKTKEDYVAELAMLLGGRMSEELFVGNVSGGARDDLNKFNALVDEYFNSGIDDIYLVNESDYRNEIKISEKMMEYIEIRKKNFITDVESYTRKILEENVDKIREIVKLLLEKEDLYESDIKNFI